MNLWNIWMSVKRSWIRLAFCTASTLRPKCELFQWAEMCVTDRWEQWRRHQWEDLLEDWAKGSLGHPHTRPDAAVGVRWLLLHERYYGFFINTHWIRHMLTCCSRSLAASNIMAEYGGRSTFIALSFLCFWYFGPNDPYQQDTLHSHFHSLPSSSLLSPGEIEPEHVCDRKRDYLAQTQSFKGPWNCVH